MIWTLMRSGIEFNLENPTPEMINISDITRALNNLCRYTGHTKRFYSVLEHSLLMANNSPEELKIHCLMHDTAEAYIGDLNSAIKSLCPEFQNIEKKIMDVIYRRYGLIMTPWIKSMVKMHDLKALATEKIHLLPHTAREWECLEGIMPYPSFPEFEPQLPIYQFMKIFQKYVDPKLW